MWPGQAFMVGERGPEVFSPKTHGTIVPNEVLGAARSRPLTVVFNVRASDPAAFRRSESQLAADAKRRWRVR